jgi:hypothetical protein
VAIALLLGAVTVITVWPSLGGAQSRRARAEAVLALARAQPVLRTYSKTRYLVIARLDANLNPSFLSSGGMGACLNPGGAPGGTGSGSRRRQTSHTRDTVTSRLLITAVGALDATGSPAATALSPRLMSRSLRKPAG